MIKIAMIRHGKTYGNTLGRYIGVTDEPLCEEGKKELEQRTMDTVELLFVSPLKRCLETADILYPYAKQVKIPEFAECNFGEFENKNYQELKDKLIKSGYAFYSQTDTEIAVKLVDYYYRKTGTPMEAISSAMLRIRGSYAFGIMFHDHPGKIFAARKDSPLIIGKSQTGCLIASDVPAILDKTRNVYYIGNHEIAELSQDEIHFYNIDREEIQKEQVEIS